MSGQILLPYNLESLPRELKRHYISASTDDIAAMLDAVGIEKLEDLYSHIPEDVRLKGALDLPDELPYDETLLRIKEIAQKNVDVQSFIGDGLVPYKVHEIVPFVASLRNLTTAYTPYQPERSQGTLLSQWIYQCLCSKLTGFEAINASLYDRASALYEAICCSIRLKKGADTVLVCESIYPGDIEVLLTLSSDNDIRIETIKIDSKNGLTPIVEVRKRIEELGERVAAIAFPQVNHLGLLEDVNALADLASYEEIMSIGIIDPMLIFSGGLKPPSDFGASGCDIIVGDGQSLAIGANFGGPGLGIFGVRHNANVKQVLRATPGRFIGKAYDAAGRDCLVQILATREQHIRKDKATSNICSNQAFLATLAGASILARGEEGMEHACCTAHDMALTVVTEILSLTNIELAFPDSAFFNEFVLALPVKASDLIRKGQDSNMHIGIDVSSRVEGNAGNLLKISLSDCHDKPGAEQLIEFFVKHFGIDEHEVRVDFNNVPESLRRLEPVGLPSFNLDDVKQFYTDIAELNVSPDDSIYPLGSCTMKYNPYINDWAADLQEFTTAHPQAPYEDVQGCLEILYEIQEWFKAITGLPGVTTQPLSGAQGELTGLKLFQAYHRDNHTDGDPNRDIILIPKSAHGTNFATAIMAGFKSKAVDGTKAGIILLEADTTGRIDPVDLDSKIVEYGRRISGIMITNPNTGGVFENAFKSIAEKIHSVGGLVYMDGANMNAICGWIDLGAMGVDAVHNNLHKTWSIPHGGGGPGDAIVAVSDKLIDYLPGRQIVKKEDEFVPVKPEKSIGSFHRHWGNFGHKLRAYTYLLRLGKEGIRRISAVAVLSSRYLLEKLRGKYLMLPASADDVPRMHEFILTLKEEDFEKLESAGIARAQVMPSIGKLFLDFGYHAPTVAFPEVFGLMIEPTETYDKAELDRFADAVLAIYDIISKKPEVLKNAPYFTPIDRVDEVSANRNVQLSEELTSLPEIHKNRVAPSALSKMSIQEIYDKICAVATD